MSHKMTVKTDIKCSLGELQEAIECIAPEWAESMLVDPSGGLGWVAYLAEQDERTGYQLVIPGGARKSRFRQDTVVDTIQRDRLVAEEGLSIQEATSRATKKVVESGRNGLYADVAFKKTGDTWSIDMDNMDSNKREMIRAAVAKINTVKKVREIAPQLGLSVDKIFSQKMPGNMKDTATISVSREVLARRRAEIIEMARSLKA